MIDQTWYTDSMTGRMTVESKFGKLSLHINDQGELEIYANDGRLISYNSSSNVLHVRREMNWGTKTEIDIIEHELKKSGRTTFQKAERVYWLLRGRKAT